MIESHLMERAHPDAMLAITTNGVGSGIEIGTLLIHETGYVGHSHRVHIHDVHSLGISAHIKQIPIHAEGMHVVFLSLLGERNLRELSVGWGIIAKPPIVAGNPKAILVVLAEVVDHIARNGVVVF